MDLSLARILDLQSSSSVGNASNSGQSSSCEKKRESVVIDLDDYDTEDEEEDTNPMKKIVQVKLRKILELELHYISMFFYTFFNASNLHWKIPLFWIMLVVLLIWAFADNKLAFFVKPWLSFFMNVGVLLYGDV